MGADCLLSAGFLLAMVIFSLQVVVTQPIWLKFCNRSRWPCKSCTLEHVDKFTVPWTCAYISPWFPSPHAPCNTAWFREACHAPLSTHTKPRSICLAFASDDHCPVPHRDISGPYKSRACCPLHISCLPQEVQERKTYLSSTRICLVAVVICAALRCPVLLCNCLRDFRIAFL